MISRAGSGPMAAPSMCTRNTLRAVRGVVFSAALIAAAMPVTAQHSATAGSAAPDALVARATAWIDDADRRDDAARLLVEAAELRPASDPRVAEELTAAARLFFYAGDHARAQRTMERAGETALANGDVVAAAHALLDAAWIAREHGTTMKVRENALRARRLMGSPLVDQGTRESVLRRIRSSPSLVVAAGADAPSR